MASPYEITPPGMTEDPDFTYPTEDPDEAIYAALFLGALAVLYNKYKSRSPEYVITNVDADVNKILKNLTVEIKQLDTFYTKTSHATLLEAGILPENLSKIKLSSNNIRLGVLEQKTTLNSILKELSSNLKSKAYYLMNREAKQVYSVTSNFNKTAKRTKTMIESGYRNTLEKAKRKAQIYLYGDPLAYWITRGDGRVCPYCLSIQDASPMPLSKLPYPPLHNRCRCKVELQKDLNLTDEAMDYTYY